MTKSKKVDPCRFSLHSLEEDMNRLSSLSGDRLFGTKSNSRGADESDSDEDDKEEADDDNEEDDDNDDDDDDDDDDGEEEKQIKSNTNNNKLLNTHSLVTLFGPSVEAVWQKNVKRRRKDAKKVSGAGKILTVVQTCYLDGNYLEAKVHLEVLIKLSPELPDSYHYMGIISEEQGNTRESLYYFIKYWQLLPENHDNCIWTMKRVAAMAFELDEYRITLLALDGVRRISPVDTSLIMMHIIASIRLGRHTQCIQLLDSFANKYKELSSEVTTFMVDYGLLLEEKGFKFHAIQSYLYYIFDVLGKDIVPKQILLPYKHELLDFPKERRTAFSDEMHRTQFFYILKKCCLLLLGDAASEGGTFIAAAITTSCIDLCKENIAEIGEVPLDVMTMHILCLLSSTQHFDEGIRLLPFLRSVDIVIDDSYEQLLEIEANDAMNNTGSSSCMAERKKQLIDDCYFLMRQKIRIAHKLAEVGRATMVKKMLLAITSTMASNKIFSSISCEVAQLQHGVALVYEVLNMCDVALDLHLQALDSNVGDECVLYQIIRLLKLYRLERDGILRLVERHYDSLFESISDYSKMVDKFQSTSSYTITASPDSISYHGPLLSHRKFATELVNLFYWLPHLRSSVDRFDVYCCIVVPISRAFMSRTQAYDTMHNNRETEISADDIAASVQGHHLQQQTSYDWMSPFQSTFFLSVSVMCDLVDVSLLDYHIQQELAHVEKMSDLNEYPTDKVQLISLIKSITKKGIAARRIAVVQPASAHTTTERKLRLSPLDSQIFKETISKIEESLVLSPEFLEILQSLPTTIAATDDVARANAFYRVALANIAAAANLGKDTIVSVINLLQDFYLHYSTGDDAASCLCLGHKEKREIDAMEAYIEAYTAQPDQPLTSLCIAIKLIYRFNSTNKYDILVKAIAFLGRYQTARKYMQFNRSTGCDESDTHTDGDEDVLTEALVEQETYYNIARSFHELNLLQLAAVQYQKAIDMFDRHPQIRSSSLSLTREAAHNYIAILQASDNTELAMEVMMKYLTF